MKRLRNIQPGAWLALYALVMPLLVGFAASPQARVLVGRLSGSELAAWGQAIGSVGAIIVAIVVSRGEARNRRREEANLHWRHVSIAVALAAEANTCLDLAYQTARGVRPNPLASENFTSVLFALDRADYAQFPHEGFLIAYVTLRRNVQLAHAQHAAIEKLVMLGRVVPQDVQDEVLRCFNTVRAATADLRRYADEVAVRLNSHVEG